MAASRHDYPDPTYEEVREALSYIPTPPSHDEWYPMAFAIKDALGENGFELWDEWSRQGEGYNSSITKSTWKSATPKAGGITVATLFKLARDNGYRPDKPYTPPTAEQLAAREAEQRARAEAAAEEQAERHAQAAKRAYGIWKNADITVDLSHGYLQKKGIADADLVRNIRQNEYQGQKQLVIPLWQNGKLVSVQTINENGGKHFLKGGQKSGSYAVLGNLDKEAHKGIAVAEGFATAASIRKATGLPVVIAFDGGNMVRIAENMAQRLSENQTVILAADNDPSGGGLAAATNAAVSLGSRARIVMPEFSPEMVQRYQTEFGVWNDSKNRENLPSDFNDLHYLAGLERVRADFDEVMERLPENVPTAEPLRVSDDATIDVPVREWRKSERAPWRNFPPVIRNGGLGDLKNEPEYTAAKSGSNAEAVHLVNRLLTDETVQLFREMAGDRDPLIVSVLATEALGNNKIPLAMAQALGRRLGLQVDMSIRQINKVSRTGAGIDHRFAFQPVFDGTVEAGRDYLIVDDTLSVGGTIAALRGYIENRGGRVIGAGVMTAHEGALTLPVKQTMIDDITRKHGDAMNNYWTKEFGYGIDHLTQGEAGHLRAAENVEQLRDRINDARLRGITGRNEQPQPLSSGQQEPPKALKPEIHTTAATEQEAAVLHSQQEQNMAQQPTDISYSADNPYAPYAAHDNEVRKNADDWEMRVPLTETMLAGFNSKAEANGFAVYIEDRHASLGRFQVGKSTENGAYRVEIDGAFKNHGSMSVQEAARDFTVSFHDGDEIVGYAYGNDFDALLKQADEWLQARQQEQTADHTQPINEPTAADKAAASLSEQEPHMENKTETKQENTIEYGGRGQLQAGIPERETITLDEVQTNLQRARAGEQIQQEKAATQTVNTETEKNDSPSESENRTVDNTMTAGQKTEHGHPLFPKSKPVLDLSYTTAVGLSGRYVRMQGKYLDINNAETVMFEDKGAKIKTAKDDPQTVSDMLDTAQAKNWDSINISGSRDFRRQMWLEAELRGIASTGYKPNKEDLALRDQLRESRERNSIEARNRPEQTKAETVRTDISNSDAQKQEPAAVTESPVLPDKTARFRAEAETLKMQADTPAETVEANQAETFVAQTANKQHGMPKPVTDTAKHKTQSVAVNHELEAAKAAYLSKADKLSKAAKNRLADHERDFTDAISGMPQKNRDTAMLHFYTSMQKRMNGTKLDMPSPTVAEQQRDNTRAIQPARSGEMEMER